jgi:thiamine pyrophosphokinase
MTSCVVIVLGGDQPDRRVRRYVPDNARVIAADAGVDHAISLGLTIDLAVGDMDSVSLAGLAHLQQERIPTERHRPDKEASDGELALHAAMRSQPDRILLVCGGGQDRLDHLLITIALLTSPGLFGARVEAWVGAAHVSVLRDDDTVQWAGRSGRMVTLLAVNGAALGVRTVGLTFPLHDETLHAWSSRGLSNESVDGPAEVSLRRGSLLVIRPNAAADLPNIE